VPCPSCQTVGDVDLRKLGRHPGATIANLIPLLPSRSSRCICRSRSVTLSDLAASNPSASAGASVCRPAVCQHVRSMIAEHNFAPGNAGYIFWYDILAPAFLVVMYVATR
jgi:hypothetical protein